MWWGHHGCGFFPLGLLLFVILCFVVIRLCMSRNFNRCSHRSRPIDGDAEAILKRRLASGEIDEAQYKQLKDLLDH